jgi:hypothetical protein
MAMLYHLATGGPDWTNFRLLLWLFTFGSFLIAKTFGTLFYNGKIYVLFLQKNGLGVILGDFFQHRIWSPCLIRFIMKY